MGFNSAFKGLNKTDRKRDTRKFYKDVRNLSNLSTVTTVVCKDIDGDILSAKSKYWKDGNNTLKVTKSWD
jgi:hypothetical protein